MGKLWSISVLGALLLLSGCSQKSTTTQSDLDKQAPVSADTNLDQVAVVGGGDNFVGMDAKSKMIEQLQSEVSPIYFDFDKYSIRPDMLPKNESNAQLFNSERAAPLTIKVEGHCDEWGTDEYNYALGLRRAKTVRDSLASNGVRTDRMIMVSYGESKPVCTTKSRDCWAQNRRVDFTLLP